MTCRHDPLYRINNEAAGGAGCPMCAAERRKAQPDYGPASHAATIAARHDQIAPDVDLNDMRDMTGKDVTPMTVEMRSWLHLLNDDNGFMGDRE